MKNHRLLIGLIFSLAFLTVITATVNILSLDKALGEVFAIVLLPFALVSLYYSVFSRQTAGVLYALISSLLAFVVMINELFLSFFTDIFYLAALAVYFVTVLLLFNELSLSQRVYDKRRAADRQAEKTARALGEAAKEASEASARAKKSDKKSTRKTASKTSGKTSEKPVKSASSRSRHRLVASLNAETTTFHRSTCQTAKRIKRGNKIYFGSRKEALDKNYSPCKICKP